MIMTSQVLKTTALNTACYSISKCISQCNLSELKVPATGETDFD